MGGYEQPIEGLLRARLLDRRTRRTGSREPTTRVSSAFVIARSGGVAMLAILLILSMGSAVATAAGGAPSPDPAPQAASSSKAGSPTPDRAPQAAPEHPAVSQSSTGSIAPVTPSPTSSGVAVVSPSSAGSQTATPTIAAPAIRAPLSARRPARRSVHRHPGWIALTVPRVTISSSGSPLGIAAAVSSRPAVSPHSGMLLLLGAVALTVLALASGSLLRLLGRMYGVRAP